jgi:uncharacterized membrane protein YidH (DUF202 family)
MNAIGDDDAGSVSHTLELRPRDPGLARERTALAWTRSALSMTVSAALIARAGLSAHQALLGLSAGAVLVAAALTTWRRGEILGQDLQLHTVTHTGAFRQLTGATLLTAAISIAVAAAL